MGGLLTQTLGWRAVFWLLVPLAAISLVIGMKTIPETSDETVPRRVDLSGIGGSLGFTWAGAVVGAGTKASYHSALWIAATIGVGAFASSLILKPRSLSIATD